MVDPSYQSFLVIEAPQQAPIALPQSLTIAAFVLGPR